MTQQVSSNNNAFFGIKVSKPGINVNQAANTELILKDDYSSRIYYNGSGVPTVLLGLRNANTFNGLTADEQGLYVSKNGIDVTQATDSQLIFNTQQDVFKIVNKITTTIPSFAITFNGSNTTGSTLLTIPHGLSFIPLVQVYVQGYLINFSPFRIIASSYIPLPFVPAANVIAGYGFNSASSTIYGGMSMFYAVDSQNIYIQAAVFESGNTADTMNAVPATIFLLQETATG